MKSDPPSTSRGAKPFTRLYDLNCGIVGMGGERHERPHKPLLLIAALDLITHARNFSGKDKPDTDAEKLIAELQKSKALEIDEKGNVSYLI